MGRRVPKSVSDLKPIPEGSAISRVQCGSTGIRGSQDKLYRRLGSITVLRQRVALGASARSGRERTLDLILANSRNEGESTLAAQETGLQRGRVVDRGSAVAAACEKLARARR